MRFLGIAVAVLTLAPAAHAGSPQPPAPGAQPTVVFAEPVVPPLAVHTPLLLAREFGYLDRLTVELETVNFEGSTRALTAALAGTIDAGFIDCLAGYGHGVPLVAFYGPAPKLALALVARDDVKTLKELRGKKMGLASAPGGIIDRLNQAALAAAGLTPADVVTVQTSSAGRVPALLSGQTDTAVFHYEHVSKVLRTRKGFHLLYDLSTALPQYQYQMVCGRKDWVERNRETAVNLTAAAILALRHAFGHQAETVKALVKVTEQAEADATYAYGRLTEGCVWARNLGLDPARLQWSIDYEHKRGAVGRRFDWDELVDMGIARQALERAGGPVEVPQGCF